MKLDMNVLIGLLLYTMKQKYITQQVFCQFLFICNAQKLKFECVCAKYSLLVNSCKSVVRYHA